MSLGEKMRTCAKCGISGKYIHKHHIVYEPEITEYLCNTCHGSMTLVNGKISRILEKKLTNPIRHAIYKLFLAKKLTHKMTDRQIKNRLMGNHIAVNKRLIGISVPYQVRKFIGNPKYKHRFEKVKP